MRETKLLAICCCWLVAMDFFANGRILEPSTKPTLLQTDNVGYEEELHYAQKKKIVHEVKIKFFGKIFIFYVLDGEVYHPERDPEYNRLRYG